jgi:cellulose biosynthesis protein BcsQ
MDSRLALIPGHLALSRFEDELSEQWPKCLDDNERALRIMSAFWRILQAAGRSHEADFILMDVGPNLGALNRAALIAADYVVIPLVPDLFSLQGLKNLGPTLTEWRAGWKKRLEEATKFTELPQGKTQPIGYVVLQHAARFDRPVKAYERWAAQIPGQYRESVLQGESSPPPELTRDPSCLALLKHYHSLMPLAQEARKPIFHLKPADGAMGSHQEAARNVYRAFETLARKIARVIDIRVP